MTIKDLKISHNRGSVETSVSVIDAGTIRHTLPNGDEVIIITRKKPNSTSVYLGPGVDARTKNLTPNKYTSSNQPDLIAGEGNFEVRVNEGAREVVISGTNILK